MVLRLFCVTCRSCCSRAAFRRSSAARLTSARSFFGDTPKAMSATCPPSYGRNLGEVRADPQVHPLTGATRTRTMCLCGPAIQTAAGSRTPGRCYATRRLSTYGLGSAGPSGLKGREPDANCSPPDWGLGRQSPAKKQASASDSHTKECADPHQLSRASPRLAS